VLAPDPPPPLLPPGAAAAAAVVLDERFVVRSVDILAFVTVDGVVLYKVSVQATEGRHWTVVRRYSDFKELEQNTWKLRGPMPPFPYGEQWCC
jgi:hypothetical protein